MLFLISCFQYILVAAVFSIGPPYRKSIWTNGIVLPFSMKKEGADIENARFAYVLHRVTFELQHPGTFDTPTRSVKGFDVNAFTRCRSLCVAGRRYYKCRDISGV